jgi:hypothetical protein
MRFTFFFIFLMATVCHLSCQDTTKNKNSEKADSNKTSLQDTSGATLLEVTVFLILTGLLKMRY